MSERTDVHRPSAIIPADYDFVGMLPPPIPGGAALGDRLAIQAHRERTGGAYSHHEHGGSCQVCGARAVYMALFWHRPSREYICTGLDCAEKLGMGDAARFRAYRKGVDDARKLHAGKAKAEALLTERGLAAAWAIYTTPADPNKPHDRDAATVDDIVAKLVRFGSLSEKQYEFLASLLKRIADRPALLAAREAERAAAAPCPTGRVTFAGVIVKVDERESMYGGSRWAPPPTVTKVTVKTDAGWVVWGTLPSSLGVVAKGDRIELTATVKPSDTDPKFGFFKRPRGNQ